MQSKHACAPWQTEQTDRGGFGANSILGVSSAESEAISLCDVPFGVEHQ